MHHSPTQSNPELTDSQVHGLTVKTLLDHVDLRIEGHKYDTTDLWNVVAAAAAQGQSIETTGEQFKEVPSASTVRDSLCEELVERTSIKALEAACNEMLVVHLPARLLGRRQKVAIDLTYISYHGQAANDPNEVCRSKAKRGTTHFHVYATAYVIKKNKRTTLALTYVTASDTLTAVLERLLLRLNQLEIPLKRLYLDKGFANVAVIRYLQTHPPTLEVLMPLVIRGKKGRALLQGPKIHDVLAQIRCGAKIQPGQI